MKAAVVTESGVQVRDVPEPQPRANEVLVRVRAAGLNRADLAVASGHSHGSIGGVGTIVGMEFAGEVAAVGSEVPDGIRGVNLLGINSQGCPMNLRQKVWQRLASDLHPKHLDKAVSRVIGLQDLPEVFEDMLAGKTHGRVVVQISE